MSRAFIACAAIVAAIAGNAAGQTTGTAGTAGTKTTATRRTVAAKPSSVRITVRDPEGARLERVRVTVSGAAAGEFTTGAAGTTMVPDLKPGVYRVRAEREGFVTLEREFTLGTGAWNPIDIVLNEAPPPPKPEPAPAPAPAPLPAVAPGGPPVAISVPDFIERNFIGRGPLKESIVACKPLETVRLLQIREPVAQHTHDRNDELVYVVAGEGAVHINGEATPVSAGSLVVLPAGSGHAFERRGKNPLVVMSTLTGSACETAKGTP
jgi:mannose-6-phosphate isomerase-like protein (cupin superfamily)